MQTNKVNKKALLKMKVKEIKNDINRPNELIFLMFSYLIQLLTSCKFEISFSRIYISKAGSFVDTESPNCIFEISFIRLKFSQLSIKFAVFYLKKISYL